MVSGGQKTRIALARAVYSPAATLLLDDPLAAPPRRPIPAGDFPPPGFEDEYEINRPPRGGGGLMMPGRSPYGIGHDDLNPPGLGPHDPLRPSFVGGGGLPRPGGGSGGMHPTLDDPPLYFVNLNVDKLHSPGYIYRLHSHAGRDTHAPSNG